jgi:hypothetical protein
VSDDLNIERTNFMKNVHIIGETFYVLFGILLKRVLGNYWHLHSSPSWIVTAGGNRKCVFIFMGKFLEELLRGNPIRWEDNIKIDLREIVSEKGR